MIKDMRIIWLALVLIISTMLLSCSKNSTSPDKASIDDASYEARTTSEMLECHEDKDWTNDQIYNRLIGKWNWILHVEGGSIGVDTSTTARQGFSVEFIRDRKMVLSDNLQDTLFFDLRGSGDAMSIFTTRDTLHHIEGYLYYCDDQILIIGGKSFIEYSLLTWYNKE